MGDILFLPVKPKWAELIMSGKKTLELRKRLPSKGYGKRCVIYASSPQREVVGTCALVRGTAHRPGPTRTDLLVRACVTKNEFHAYFDHAHYTRFGDPFDERWYALELSDPGPFQRVVTLQDMRARWKLECPQQWRYIDGETLDEIVRAGNG